MDDWLLRLFTNETYKINMNTFQSQVEHGGKGITKYLHRKMLTFWVPLMTLKSSTHFAVVERALDDSPSLSICFKDTPYNKHYKQ